MMRRERKSGKRDEARTGVNLFGSYDQLNIKRMPSMRVDVSNNGFDPVPRPFSRHWGWVSSVGDPQCYFNLGV